MKVYCFGNEFLEEDSLAKIIADEISLEGIEFVKCNSPEEIFEHKQDEIVILDVVKDIDKVILIEDLNQLKPNNLYTLHDFDLSYFLNLMKKMGRIRKIKIIGIPMRGDKEKIKENIIRLIEKMTYSQKRNESFK